MDNETNQDIITIDGPKGRMTVDLQKMIMDYQESTIIDA